ncbi:hypothetical protein [Streptomyces yangpuensis]|uniref:hypothetical protein n=1 Tax=Streptomyces yangpuensis TaxID=1648182 RepID=UPI00367B6E1E
MPMGCGRVKSTLDSSASLNGAGLREPGKATPTILKIDDIGMAIFGVGLLVGYAVHKHSRSASGPASKGDLVGAIGAGTAVATALLLLFGGDGRQSTAPDPQPSGRALSVAVAGIPASHGATSGLVTIPSGPARTSAAS